MAAHDPAGELRLPETERCRTCSHAYVAAPTSMRPASTRHSDAHRWDATLATYTESLTNLIIIVDADANLANLLDEPERERARREALTRVNHFSVGEWDAAQAAEP